MDAGKPEIVDRQAEQHVAQPVVIYCSEHTCLTSVCDLNQSHCTVALHLVDCISVLLQCQSANLTEKGNYREEALCICQFLV